MTWHSAWQSGDIMIAYSQIIIIGEICHSLAYLRNNLSGADQLFVTKFNELFGRAAYSEAAKVNQSSSFHLCYFFEL